MTAQPAIVSLDHQSILARKLASGHASTADEEQAEVAETRHRACFTEIFAADAHQDGDGRRRHFADLHLWVLEERDHKAAHHLLVCIRNGALVPKNDNLQDW